MITDNIFTNYQNNCDGQCYNNIMNILIKQDHICQENSGGKIRKETEINQTTRYINNKIPVTHSPTFKSNRVNKLKLNL